jgi:hypothetical protein
MVGKALPIMYQISSESSKLLHSTRNEDLGSLLGSVTVAPLYFFCIDSVWFDFGRSKGLRASFAETREISYLDEHALIRAILAFLGAALTVMEKSSITCRCKVPSTQRHI